MSRSSSTTGNGLQALGAKLVRAEIEAKLAAQVHELPGNRTIRTVTRYVPYGSGWLELSVPQARDRNDQVVYPEAYTSLTSTGDQRAQILSYLEEGMSTRGVARHSARFSENGRPERGWSAATVQRRGVDHRRSLLNQLMFRPLWDLELIGMWADGVSVLNQTALVAIGVTRDGQRVPLGVALGPSESAALAAQLARGLVDRGADLSEAVLTLDGSGQLRAGFRQVLGADTLIQNCTFHFAERIRMALPGPLDFYGTRHRLDTAIIYTADRGKARKLLLGVARELTNAGRPEAGATVRARITGVLAEVEKVGVEGEKRWKELRENPVITELYSAVHGDVPASLWEGVNPRLTEAWALNSPDESLAALKTLALQLVADGRDEAAKLLAEDRQLLDETLTISRLGVEDADLAANLRQTAISENLNKEFRRRTHNVRRWRSGEMIDLWVAEVVAVAEAGWKRVGGPGACQSLDASVSTARAQLRKKLEIEAGRATGGDASGPVVAAHETEGSADVWMPDEYRTLLGDWRAEALARRAGLIRVGIAHRGEQYLRGDLRRFADPILSLDTRQAARVLSLETELRDARRRGARPPPTVPEGIVDLDAIQGQTPLVQRVQEPVAPVRPDRERYRDLLAELRRVREGGADREPLGLDQWMTAQGGDAAHVLAVIAVLRARGLDANTVQPGGPRARAEEAQTALELPGRPTDASEAGRALSGEESARALDPPHSTHSGPFVMPPDPLVSFQSQLDSRSVARIGQMAAELSPGLASWSDDDLEVAIGDISADPGALASLDEQVDTWVQQNAQGVARALACANASHGERPLVPEAVQRCRAVLGERHYRDITSWSSYFGGRLAGGEGIDADATERTALGSLRTLDSHLDELRVAAFTVAAERTLHCRAQIAAISQGRSVAPSRDSVGDATAPARSLDAELVDLGVLGDARATTIEAHAQALDGLTAALDARGVERWLGAIGSPVDGLDRQSARDTLSVERDQKIAAATRDEHLRATGSLEPHSGARRGRRHEEIGTRRHEARQQSAALAELEARQSNLNASETGLDTWFAQSAHRVAYQLAAERRAAELGLGVEAGRVSRPPPTRRLNVEVTAEPDPVVSEKQPVLASPDAGYGI
ncbi:MAG: transposase [Solirubrobacteraceae bacterium]